MAVHTQQPSYIDVGLTPVNRFTLCDLTVIMMQFSAATNPSCNALSEIM